MGKRQSLIQDLIWINTSNTLVSDDPPSQPQTVGWLRGEQRSRETPGVRVDSTLNMGTRFNGMINTALG